jgi:hypothetical protein
MAAKKSKKGMGFKAAQKQIAKKQGVSMESAGAILASGARKASPEAKRKNPNLMKVSGVKKTAKKSKAPSAKKMERQEMKSQRGY